MTAPAPEAFLDRLCAQLNGYFRLHQLVFVVVNLGLHALNIAQGAPWWALWPLMIWGIPFSIHYFIYKSLSVTEAWADERIDDLRWRAYDLGHVEDLEDRIRADDFSTRPVHRRDPDWWQRSGTAEDPAASADSLAQPGPASPPADDASDTDKSDERPRH